MKKSPSNCSRAGWLCLLLLLCLHVVQAQTRTITGKVTDGKDNQPLSGVSVQVKNGPAGTQTGADGNYSLELPATAKTLVFSFIGYDNLEVTIGSSNVINATLTMATGNALQDV